MKNLLLFLVIFLSGSLFCMEPSLMSGNREVTIQNHIRLLRALAMLPGVSTNITSPLACLVADLERVDQLDQEVSALKLSIVPSKKLEYLVIVRNAGIISQEARVFIETITSFLDEVKIRGIDDMTSALMDVHLRVQGRLPFLIHLASNSREIFQDLQKV